MNKLFGTLLLGFSLALMPPVASAEPAAVDSTQQRRPDYHHDIRRPGRHREIRRPDIHHDYRRNYSNRRGAWRHGRVQQRNGRFRFAPSIRFRARRHYHRHNPIIGLWTDILRFGIGNDNQAYQIGSTILDNGPDYDVIDVTDTNNCVKKMRLRVEEADALIDRMVVRYVDGSDQELDVNGYYAEGSGDSSWRDVPGWSKCVDSIVVVGQTQNQTRFGANARVEVWGLR